MSEPDPIPFLPLREPTFFILLSLLPGEKHGYAILKEVEQISQKRVQLSTGTLYEALARLLEQELIERSEDGAAPGPGRPRKLYRLTRLGRRVITAEAERLAQLSDAAHRQIRDQRAGG